MLCISIQRSAMLTEKIINKLSILNGFITEFNTYSCIFIAQVGCHFKCR